jgi:hypothetical protein
MRINLQGLKDNAQHLTGHVVGLLILRPMGLRFGKDARGTRWFSTVAANSAADGWSLFLPYVVIVKTP